MPSILPALHRAAPRLTRKLFQCRHHSPNPAALLLPSALQAMRLYSFRTFKTRVASFSSAVTNPASLGPQSLSPLSLLSQAVKRKQSLHNQSFFPEISSKSTAYWLLGSAASVFGIVVFGGLTRLTESGYGAFHLPSQSNN